MTDALHVLAISGSLRKGSFNTALLREAEAHAPEGMTFSHADLRDIPLYDDDVRQQGFPEPVVRFRSQIAAADALLIATPEYNYSVPGVLKNAIDWASRPPKQPFEGKPLALVGAAQSMGGTMRAQYHLRQIAVFLDIQVVNRPEVFVRTAQTVFDADGKLTDETAKKLLTQLLVNLATLTRKMRA